MAQPPTPYIWTEFQKKGRSRWSRQLGGYEAAFYWDSKLSGAGDVLSNTHIVLDASDAHLLTNAQNVQNVWRAVKYRHPLLAASIIENDASQTPQFVLHEERIEKVYPGEIELRFAESMEEYSRICSHFDNGPRMLSSQLLSQLVVLGVPAPAGDTKLHYYILIATSHAITDVQASYNIIRTFLDILSSPRDEDATDRLDVGHRLTILPAIDHLFIGQALSPARVRWRRAAARVIMQRRLNKGQGTSIAPGQNTTRLPPKPALCRRRVLSLDVETTKTVLSRCRSRGITFGQAFPVLCQLATGSIIHDTGFGERKREHLKRQPSHFVASFNIKPFLDRDWLRQGGMSEVLTTGTTYEYSLPSLSLDASGRGMVLKERFFDRCRLVKKWMKFQEGHPLLLDFAGLHSVSHEAERRRFMGLRREWGHGPSSDLMKSNDGHVKFSSVNQVSVLGTIDNILPRTYPRDAENPFITVLSNDTWSKALPGQFYATACTWNNRLEIMCSWDGNVYDEKMAIGWIDNLACFMRKYLANSRQETDINVRALL